MDYSIEMLYDKYKEEFNSGLNSYKSGNYIYTRNHFERACECLEKLIALKNEDENSVDAKQLERIKSIIKKIDEQASSMNNTYYNNFSSANNISSDLPNNVPPIENFIKVYMPNELPFGFEGVIGLEKAKDAIVDYVINPIKYPEAYNYNFENNSAILLYGPPGTGKTTFGMAVANEIGWPFFLVRMSSIINAYVGMTGKQIDMIFNYMRECAKEYKEKYGKGIIAFFDEFDEIAKKPGEDKTSDTATPALKRNLSGVEQNTGLIVIANSNYKDLLDRTILDRFRRKIEIPLPNKDERKQLFLLKLNDLEPEIKDKINMNLISEFADGVSGRTISYIADDFKHVIAKIKSGQLDPETDINEELLRIIKDLKNDTDGG